MYTSVGQECWPVKRFAINILSDHHTEHEEMDSFKTASSYAQNTLGMHNNMGHVGDEVYTEYTIMNRDTGKCVQRGSLDEGIIIVSTPYDWVHRDNLGRIAK